MNKYIVKNCPSCIISPSCCAKYHIDNGHAKDCQDIEDCVIKQEIEKCKEAIDECKSCGCSEQHWVCIGEKAMSAKILNMFDIEEVRE